MQYSLRTLLIFMLIAGPLSARGWQRYIAYQDWKAERAQREEAKREQAKLLQLGSRSFPSIYSPAIHH
jgi:hypothetical protein